MKPKLLVLALIVLLIAPAIASGATIYGTIYDFELNNAVNSIVEIDTVPKQSFVSKDGTYSFTAPLGNYTIKAKSGDNTAEEELIIIKEGSYLRDLILFPDLSEEEDIIAETELNVTTDYFEEKSYLPYYIAGIVLLFCLILAILFFYKRKIEKQIKKEITEVKKEKEIKESEKELSPELKELIQFIKKENGRATQKEIRKNFPQSEAKISLMVAELEAMGKIKKIKKGRGNIIVLK